MARLLTEDEIEYIVDFIVPAKHLPPETGLSIARKNKEKIVKMIKGVKLVPEGIDEFKNAIKSQYSASQIQPGESVGILTAQSIGERQTQSTLNSVAYDTELLLFDNGELSRVTIGDFVEKHMSLATKEELELHPNDTSYAPVHGDVRIISTDENGKISWTRVEAVTRHPVINEDGSNTVIKVTTKSGRSVVATKGWSFLVRQNNKVLKFEGKNLRVGHYLPVNMDIFPVNDVYTVDKLELKNYLPKTEYIYGSDVYKAIELKKTGKRNWWSANVNKEFVVPYSRSDIFLQTYFGTPSRPRTPISDIVKDGFVYPKHIQTQHDKVGKLPETIPLDEDFGFMCGAFLADGHLTDYHTMISKNDETFLGRVRAWFDRYETGYHMDGFEDERGKSTTIRAHSLVLTTLFRKLFGNHAENKRVPPFMLGAPDDFLRGLVDGYFSGDGSVGKSSIRAYSVCHGLLEDIRLILSKFGVKSKISIESEKTHQKNLEKYKKATRGASLSISLEGCIQFNSQFRLTMPYKQDALSKMTEDRLKDAHCNSFIPDLVLGNMTMTVKKDDLQDIALEYPQYRKIIQDAMDEEVSWDEVVSIEEMPCATPYVYDLTVEKTRNFCLYNNLHQRDTFHQAGLSVKTVITGVPRFTELLNTTKDPKAKTCTIYYKGKHSDIQSLRDKVGNTLRHLTLKKLKKRTSFTCEKRKDWWYEDFDMFYGNLYEDFKYSIRWEFDMDKVFEYQVRIEDIASIIQEHFDDIKCAFAPEQEGVLDVYIDTSHVNIEDTIFESVEEAIESYIEDTVIPEVESHRLYGVEGIEDIFFEKKGDEWVVETEGSNLSKVFALSNIDFARTLCNNMWEIYQTLGIEATRNFLLEEFDNVVSSDGNFVHQSHTMLLVDIMTFQGTLTSINRYGLKNEQCGPLSKASFEESLDNFLKAAAFGEKENTKSVSASIMLGKTGRFGTGICDLIVNIGQNPGMPQTIREDVIEKTPRKVF